MPEVNIIQYMKVLSSRLFTEYKFKVKYYSLYVNKKVKIIQCMQVHR